MNDTKLDDILDKDNDNIPDRIDSSFDLPERDGLLKQLDDEKKEEEKQHHSTTLMR